MTIFLHVGTPKTGSTSIQVTLEANQQKLLQRGIYTTQVAGRRNNRRFTMYAQDDHVIDNLRRAKGYLTLDRIEKFRQKFRSEFLAEAATWPKDKIGLATSEQMASLRSASALERLRELIAATGHDAKIIVYFRRQDGLLLSEYSQFIKGGKDLTLEEAITSAKTRRIYDYYKVASTWARTFGRENVIVRPFERSQFKDGDLLTDFLSILGLEDWSDFTIPETQNESLDIYAMEYLRLFNRHVPRWGAAGRNPMRAGLVEHIGAISNSGPKMRLRGTDAEAFVSHFADSNAKVAREFLGREDGRLFYDGFHGDEPVEVQPLTLDQAMEMTALLWARLRTESLAEAPAPAKRAPVIEPARLAEPTSAVEPAVPLKSAVG